MSQFEEIEKSSHAVNETVAHMMGISSDPSQTYPLMESAMGTKRMTVYRLATFCAFEMERCVQNGAYLAGCLMGVSANEALLTLMVLMFQEQVIKTSVYSRARKEATYELTVSQWRLETLIKVSEELHWISEDLVNEEIVDALIVDFPVAARTIYPKMNASDLEKELLEIRRSPGTQMLRFSQELRNFVHGPRWIRKAAIFVEPEFQANWKLAMVISTEVAKCLLTRITRETTKVVEQVAKLVSDLSEAEKVELQRSVLERLAGQ